MINSIEEKVQEYVKRLENEDDSSVVISELIVYLEGIRDSEKDPMRSELLSGFMMSLNLAKSIIALTKKITKENDARKSQLNSQLERIVKLEKRFDDLDAGK